MYDALGRIVVTIAGTFTNETLLEQDFCATETFEAMFPSKQLCIQNWSLFHWRLLGDQTHSSSLMMTWCVLSDDENFLSVYPSQSDTEEFCVCAPDSANHVHNSWPQRFVVNVLDGRREVRALHTRSLALVLQINQRLETRTRSLAGAA